MASFYGEKLRKVKKDQRILPFIGIYDVFSASIVANYHDCLFVSGFGFAASHYGLPDIGFNTWTDLLNYVMRIRNILPNTHILVDIDDGFVDIHNAKMITSCLLDAGASGIILEDQARPRRCGHYNGKNLVTAEAYVQKLEAVMKVSQDLFIVARTDASQVDDILERVNKIKQFPVDCILVDGMSVEQLCSFEVLHEFRQDNKIAYNQITGGKSSPHDLNELEECGIGVAIFSTPCLFTAQFAMQKAMHELIANNYLLNKIEDSITLSECTEVLNNNLLRRFKEDGSN